MRLNRLTVSRGISTCVSWVMDTGKLEGPLELVALPSSISDKHEFALPLFQMLGHPFTSNKQLTIVLQSLIL
ncbi:hypothetical protein Nepgr_022603 [Nepenthes gracilis]|uniref:Uncharacterized protein n=1 Tax=Nepenthes gracilis TaxID=150966 RepID=A0AAD3XYK5_NEPGR|nr:hypothetical protein Nepgr_022603 [Nepenthes gracilis]